MLEGITSCEADDQGKSSSVLSSGEITILRMGILGKPKHKQRGEMYVITQNTTG